MLFRLKNPLKTIFGLKNPYKKPYKSISNNNIIPNNNKNDISGFITTNTVKLKKRRIAI